MIEPRMARAPARDGLARPPPDGQPDDAVGHALNLGMPAPRAARLEHRSRHVPLQQVDAPAARVGEVGELVDQQALAGARQPREEHQARLARERVQVSNSGEPSSRTRPSTAPAV
jgi:hypothetical protein